MNGNQIEENQVDEEVIDIDEKDESQGIVIYDISSYGADYDVEGLVKRLDTSISTRLCLESS